MSDKSVQYELLYSKASPYREVESIFTIIYTSSAIILIISLLLVIHQFKSAHKKIDFVLCILLLWCDLFCSLISFLNAIFGLFHYNKHIATVTLCNLDGIIVYSLFTAAINLMGIISLERCLLIVFKKEYSNSFYYGILLIYFGIDIIVPIQTSLNVGFKISPIALYCIFDPSTTGGLIGSVIAGLSCGSAYFLIVTCYLAICFYRRSQSKKAQLELGLDPAKVKKEVNRTIIKSLSIILASLFTSGIYVTILVVSWFYPPVLTNVIDMIQVLFIQPQMIINTLILLNMKPELWKGLKKLYGFRTD